MKSETMDMAGPGRTQIQQITSRLKQYGHIEEKNVFYWFQNRKARQRQKQKQENTAYINRYLHKAYQPVFSPLCSNVICGSYYLPRRDLGFYLRYPKVLLPNGFKRRPRSEKIDKARAYAFTDSKQETIDDKFFGNNEETLPLFLLHPTGVLQGRAETLRSLGSMICAAENSIANSASSSSEMTTGVEDVSSDKPFFDIYFFFHETNAK
ncbi:hypothetical protein MANES_11G131800v8 [Manihot esculenta]|uniref:Homeobox domain-containing protein n=1 Tax=Manihot esculenta TaxID=3983 RepID=A0A2C9V2I9_MANES|nr:hypothetical protein MANES_11G131800v8 [Manihot esculenta]